MTKSYADICLERAEKAIPGPWHTAHINEAYPREADIEGPNGECVADEVTDHTRDFIIHSIQDVPELARRLNEAILRLRESAHIILSEGLVDDEEYQEEIAYIDSLEAIPEKKE